MSEKDECEALDDWIGRLRVAPGASETLAEHDPAARPKGLGRSQADALTAAAVADLDRLQYLLYADGSASLLIVLQGLDASGKDGTIRHVLTGMNPQGTRVAAFQVPTPEEAAHDFLWRVHRAAPRKGEVAIFNRSHYEDVLVVRVHGLVPEAVWKARFDQINAFEELLAASGTRVLKFFLHISPEEQLARFAKRLEDPARRWKISEADYIQRSSWHAYIRAYEDVLARCSTTHAPWHVIPSDRKWVRNLAVARIIVNHLEEIGLTTPPVRVDLRDIRRRYHDASNAES